MESIFQHLLLKSRTVVIPPTVFLRIENVYAILFSNINTAFFHIKDLVHAIADLIDYKGEIVWDKNKPNGQPRRMLDTSKARDEFGFAAKIPFDEGLKKTIDWYINNRVDE